MKFYLSIFIFLAVSAGAYAQVELISYDGASNIYEPALLAVTTFPGEADVIYYARFSPKERCTIKEFRIGMSVVKFDQASGDDTLLVFLFDSEDHPMQNLFHTWRVPLGDDGYPSPNRTSGNPLTIPWRAMNAITLAPAPVIAPKRDFMIGVRLQTKQKYAVGDGKFQGLCLAFVENPASYTRYHRYTRFTDGTTAVQYASATNRYALYMRASVEYDATLPDTKLTDMNETPAPVALSLSQNYPNPFTSVSSVEYSIPGEGYATLSLHDMLGRTVSVLASGNQEHGTHIARIDAAQLGLTPGMYILRLRQGATVITRNITLMR